MANDTDQNFKAYINVTDASLQAVATSELINKRVADCLKKLNTFLNLDDTKRPAIVDPYKPENHKPRPPAKSSQ